MSDNLNQTQFFDQEPVLEKNQTVLSNSLHPEADVKAAAKGKKLILTLLVVMAVIIVLLLALLLLLPSNKNTPVAEPSPTPSAQPVTNQTEKQVMVKELQAQLQEADPSVEEFAFPPVDLELNLSQ